MRMSHFDWSVRVLVGPFMSAMWFDRNALEMTTAEHCMHLTNFCELLVCQCMWYGSGEFNHNKVTTSQIYKSWSLHHSDSTRT